MTMPAPRGPISTAILTALRDDDLSGLTDLVQWPAPDDALTDDDLQLSLWVCYELHYRGLASVSDHWEWEPDLLRVRRVLEEQLLDALRRDVPERASSGLVEDRLWALVDSDDGPPLSRFLQRDGDLEQFREFAIHRSIYQLKEADPYTWVVPRLRGDAKAALVEIQVDEYGNGSADRMHSEMYRAVLRGLDLDDGYAAYVDNVPGITLAISNVMSLFGLHRSLRGALVGHFAAYEMTSSAPCRRYAKGLRRLGLPDGVCAFYDVHVTADALHEQLAAHDLCGALAQDEPGLADQIMFGAAACLYVDDRFAGHVMSHWSNEQSSLRGNPLGARPGRVDGSRMGLITSVA